MTRQEANILILGRIAEEITRHPDGRFGQILSNLRILEHNTEPDVWEYYLETLDYNEESVVTLGRINKGESIDE